MKEIDPANAKSVTFGPSSEEEANLLKEFAEAMSHLNQDEKTLLRFLRARNLNLNKAGEMLTNTIEWRKKFNIDECRKFVARDSIIEHFKFEMDTVDSDKRIVACIPAGKWEVHKFIKEGHLDEMRKHLYRQFEEIMQRIEKSPYENMKVIIDMEGLTYQKIANLETVQLVLHVFRVFEAHYPERLHEAIVVNAPWSFSCIFHLVKPLLTGKTLSKTQIFDSNANNWLPILQDSLTPRTVEILFPDTAR